MGESTEAVRRSCSRETLKMRVNIYAEELTPEVQMVTTEAKSRASRQRFHGVRILLKSPFDLHHSPKDDDRSAVTFWVPWTQTCGLNFELPLQIFRQAVKLLEEAQNRAL